MNEQKTTARKVLTYLTIVAVSLTLIGTIGAGVFELMNARETIKKFQNEEGEWVKREEFERVVIELKSTQDSILRTQKSLEINTYAIAVKLNVEGIIKPVDK